MMKSTVKRLISLVCVLAVFVCGMPQAVQAESLKEKIERLKGELEQINENIDNYNASIEYAEQLKIEYASQRVVIEELLAANLESTGETETAIANKQDEIADKREVIYENEELFQERVVAIYKMNNSNPMSTLLSVNSFAEFLTVANNLKAVTQHDTDLLDMLAGQRAALETELGELDVLLGELETKTSEYNDLVAQLAGNIQAQDAAISAYEAEIAAQEQVYDKTYEELENAQKEMAAIQAAMKTQGSTSYDGSQFTGGTLTWPVPGFYNVSCEYGSPDPNGTPHRGMDISGGGGNIHGAPVVAGHDGVVLIASFAHGSYGNYVVVDHGGGLKSLYAHCNTLAVGVGETVVRGQTIATVGSTGFSTGPHLHLEVHLDGALQNPRGYLSA